MKTLQRDTRGACTRAVEEKYEKELALFHATGKLMGLMTALRAMPKTSKDYKDIAKLRIRAEAEVTKANKQLRASIRKLDRAINAEAK